MVGLADCNNFYVSCERLFNPSLLNRAVVVLSNNDGCIVARSNEAKSLGIKMGTPIYQIKDLLREHNIAVYSSNYPLYADLSNRVMTLLGSYVEEQEIYSIDECFLSFNGFRNYNLNEYGRMIVRTVTKGTGIPISLGIAETKTLAKIANKFAKKYPGYQGVCIIDNEEKREKALKLFDIADVWGIGRRHTARLERQGVKTAYDFTRLPIAWVRKNMTVTGERTYKELLGESCIDMELTSSNRKQICTSRSFGEMISRYEDMLEAVANYAGNCARKLRQQNSVAISLMVFIHTNHFRSDLPQYAKNIIIPLHIPTSDTIEIVRHAEIGLSKIFRSGFLYKKAGVIITEIANKDHIQMDLFETTDFSKSEKLIQAIDTLNDKYHKSVRLAVQGTDSNPKWHLRQKNLSYCYTTNINDIITIKCK